MTIIEELSDNDIKVEEEENVVDDEVTRVRKGVEAMKEEGNVFFKKGDHEKAEQCYKGALDEIYQYYLDTGVDKPEELNEEVNDDIEEEESSKDAQGNLYDSRESETYINDDDEEDELKRNQERIAREEEESKNEEMKEKKDDEDVETTKEEEEEKQKRKAKELDDLELLIHNNIAACYLKREMYDEVVKECTKALEIDQTNVKAFFRRYKAYEALEKYHEALNDFQQAYGIPPGAMKMDLKDSEKTKKHMMDLYQKYKVPYDAQLKMFNLQNKAKEQYEKQLKEMWGQLKDLGNTLLSPFGIDLNKFQAKQDPGTGSYSFQYGNN